jgi:hypothetical protein
MFAAIGPSRQRDGLDAPWPPFFDLEQVFPSCVRCIKSLSKKTRSSNLYRRTDRALLLVQKEISTYLKAGKHFLLLSMES